MNVNSLGIVAPSWSTIATPDTWQPLSSVLARVLAGIGSRIAVGSGAPWSPPPRWPVG